MAFASTTTRTTTPRVASAAWLLPICSSFETVALTPAEAVAPTSSQRVVAVAPRQLPLQRRSPGLRRERGHVRRVRRGARTGGVLPTTPPTLPPARLCPCLPSCACLARIVVNSPCYGANPAFGCREHTLPLFEFRRLDYSGTHGGAKAKWHATPGGGRLVLSRGRRRLSRNRPRHAPRRRTKPGR